MSVELQAREVTSHRGNFLNDKIKIEAVGPIGPGGAYQAYRMETGGPAFVVDIPFQQGNPAEKITGFSNEALLAILVHRLQGFDRGNFRTRENSLALTKLQEAQFWLDARTKDRVARGVEGTQQQ